MNLNEYQKEALKFRTLTANQQYALLNLSGEVGELHSLLAKAIRDGADEYFETNIEKELGDILWHIAAIADDYGMNLNSIANINLAKLASRRDRGVLGGSGDNR